MSNKLLLPVLVLIIIGIAVQTLIPEAPKLAFFGAAPAGAAIIAVLLLLLRGKDEGKVHNYSSADKNKKVKPRNPFFLD